MSDAAAIGFAPSAPTAISPVTRSSTATPTQTPASSAIASTAPTADVTASALAATSAAASASAVACASTTAVASASTVVLPGAAGAESVVGSAAAVAGNDTGLTPAPVKAIARSTTTPAGSAVRQQPRPRMSREHRFRPISSLTTKISGPAPGRAAKLGPCHPR